MQVGRQVLLADQTHCLPARLYGTYLRGSALVKYGLLDPHHAGVQRNINLFQDFGVSGTSAGMANQNVAVSGLALARANSTWSACAGIQCWLKQRVWNAGAVAGEGWWLSLMLAYP